MVAGCEKTVIADELKGSFLLYNANLSQNDRKIVLSSVKSLKYADVRSQLKRVFDEQNPGGTDQIDVVETADGEETFYTNRRSNSNSFKQPRYTDTRKFAASYSQGPRKKSNSNHGNSSSRYEQPHNSNYRNSSRNEQPQTYMKGKVKKMNPLQRDGTRSYCFECGSYDHWSSVCPDKQKRLQSESFHHNTNRRVVFHGEHHEEPRYLHYEDYDAPRCSHYQDYDAPRSSRYGDTHEADYIEESSDEEAYVVLMNTDMQTLTNVTSKYAIIDTACSKGVMGLDWFEGFYQDLPDEYSDKMIFHKGHSSSSHGACNQGAQILVFMIEMCWYTCH